MTYVKFNGILYKEARKERWFLVTIRDYRIALGWSLGELARRSGLTYQTISRIEQGKFARLHTAGAIARALSEGMGKPITIRDLEDIRIFKEE